LIAKGESRHELIETNAGNFVLDVLARS